MRNLASARRVLVGCLGRTAWIQWRRDETKSHREDASLRALPSSPSLLSACPSSCAGTQGQGSKWVGSITLPGTPGAREMVFLLVGEGPELSPLRGGSSTTPQPSPWGFTRYLGGTHPTFQSSSSNSAMIKSEQTICSVIQFPKRRVKTLARHADSAWLSSVTLI
jgi:hypothetical protein